MTVAELLGRIDSRELSEWIAYDQIEPFGEERADIRSAIIACTMANAWRGKNAKAFSIDDFMPKFGPKEKQTEDEMKKILKNFMVGG